MINTTNTTPALHAVVGNSQIAAVASISWPITCSHFVLNHEAKQTSSKERRRLSAGTYLVRDISNASNSERN